MAIEEIVDRPALYATLSHDALEELLTVHGPDIRAQLQRMLHSPEEAEDVYDIVAEKIWRRASEFRGDSSIKTWIYSVTRNAAINYQKRERGSLKRVAFDFAMIPDPEDSVLLQLERAETAERLRKLIDRLPRKQRTLIELLYLQHYSYADIAELLQMPEGSVRSGLNAARNKLKMLMGDAGIHGLADVA